MKTYVFDATSIANQN